MKIINFNTEFRPKIEAGIKTSTMRGVRADGKIPYCKDEWVQFYTGMRTSAAQCFGYARIAFVKEILLRMYDDGETATMGISDWDGWISKDDTGFVFPFNIYELREKEGFENDLEMFRWFWNSNKTAKCAPDRYAREVREFKGWVIQWDVFTTDYEKVQYSREIMADFARVKASVELAKNTPAPQLEPRPGKPL